jgi:hypothetical protein
MTHEVAATILQQLGGRRFMAMTGVKQCVGSADALSFSIPMRTRNTANKCRITLTPMDVYTVEFFRYNTRTLELTALDTHEDVYADMLQDVFTQATGLYTHV